MLEGLYENNSYEDSRTQKYMERWHGKESAKKPAVEQTTNIE